MNNLTDKDEQPNTEPAPKRKRRKYKLQKLGGAGLAAQMQKKGSIKLTWGELSNLFHRKV